MTDLSDIIAKLENATEGSNALNNQIALSVGWYRITPSDPKYGSYASPKHGGWIHPSDVRDGEPVFCQLHGTDVWHAPLDYTRSVDAALTLVPKGHDWIVANVNGHVGGTPYACVGSESQHHANTPVLALCIAALKARSAP